MVRYFTSLILCIVIAAGTAATLRAQESDVSLSVLQLYRAQGERDPALERVMRGAMSVGLSRVGVLYASVPAPQRTAEAFPDDGIGQREALERDRLIRFAREYEADLLLLGVYRLQERTVEVHYELSEVTSGDQLATTVIRSEIDLLVDRAFDQAATALYAQASAQIAMLLAYKARIVRLPDGDGDTRAEPPDEFRPEPSSPDAQAPHPAPVAVERRFEAGVSAGPAIAMGSFSDYFGPGLAGDLWFHYRLHQLAIGLLAGVVRTVPERENTGEYVRTFVPVLVQAQFRVGRTGPLEWSTLVAAGAAMRVHDGSTVSDRIAPALPAWRVGFGARVPLTQRVTLSPAVEVHGMVHLYRENNGDPVEVEHILLVAPTIGVGLAI